MKAHKLLTKAIEKTLPRLYGTEKVPMEEKVALVKFFLPGTCWTWYGVELDARSGEFFGWEQGPEGEGLTYFSLATLESLRGPWNLKVERDAHFSPRKLGEVLNLAA